MNIIRIPLLAAFLVIALLLSARAQDAQSPLSFTVTVQEAQIIGEALSKMPYGTVAQLIAKLQQQVTEQQKKEPPK